MAKGEHCHKHNYILPHITGTAGVKTKTKMSFPSLKASESNTALAVTTIFPPFLKNSKLKVKRSVFLILTKFGIPYLQNILNKCITNEFDASNHFVYLLRHFTMILKWVKFEVTLNV